MFDMRGEHQMMCRSGGKEHDWRRESSVHIDWNTQKISRRNLIVVIDEGHYRLAYSLRATPPPTPNPYYMR